jgi:hypothetical protein
MKIGGIEMPPSGPETRASALILLPASAAAQLFYGLLLLLDPRAEARGN